MAATTQKMRRANIVLPEELYDALKEAAEKRHSNVNALLRSCIKLGLLALEIENDPDSALLIREGDREREIMLL